MAKSRKVSRALGRLPVRALPVGMTVLLCLLPVCLTAVLRWPGALAEVRPPASDVQLGPFNIEGLTIARKDIYSGGPPKDGIPALLEPDFSPADLATYLAPEDEVIGVHIGGESKAYPLRILVWHELANDTVGGVPIAVTYCPLCGTCMVFDRRVDGETHTFGVSRLLYQSDVLFYDHQQHGLWSQLKMAAVSGPLAGKPLQWIPSERTRWGRWRTAYPQSQVLTDNTGYGRNYGRMPYRGYEKSAKLLFPVPASRNELAPKTWVVGVLVNGSPQAYPKALFPASGSNEIRDTVGGVKIRIVRDPSTGAIRAKTESDEVLPVVEVYWFAWQAFYPTTDLYHAQAR
jgi:hypothetical protein